MSGRVVDAVRGRRVDPGRLIEHAEPVLTGRLLAESLVIGADLEVPDLRLVRCGRHDVAGSVTPDQPTVWTFVDFEAPDDRAVELAAALSAVLQEGGGWYADFRTDDTHFVVFAGRVFSYSKGDPEGRAAAVAHGRAVGVPESQLDWDA